MDWNHLRAFRETAQRGSLSAAARHMGLTQSTLSRQVAALEHSLGVTLFERVGRTVVITQAGQALLEHAHAMGAAADALALAASGNSQAVEGNVTVSASELTAACLLPPVLQALRAVAPAVAVDVIATDAYSDLLRREADIAVRHSRPTQPELIGRVLREAPAGFYAAQSWVQRHGHPRTAQDVRGLEFVGADRDGRYVGYLNAHGLPVVQAQMAVRCENTLVAWQLVQRGLGIGVMLDEVGLNTPGVVRVLDEVAPIMVPMWLVTHRELHTARRIRVVFELLAQHLGEAQPAPNAIR